MLWAVQRKRGDQAAMLPRAHVQTNQSEVGKITLHQARLARLGGRGRRGRNSVRLFVPAMECARWRPMLT